MNELRKIEREARGWVFRHYFDPVTMPTIWLWRRLTRAA